MFYANNIIYLVLYNHYHKYIEYNIYLQDKLRESEEEAARLRQQNNDQLTSMEALQAQVHSLSTFLQYSFKSSLTIYQK